MAQPSGDDIIQRYEDLKSRRGMWEAHWQDVLDVTLPRKADVTVARSPGAKRSEKMFDSTAAQAAGDLASSLQSALTPRDRPWFAFRARGLEQDHMVRDWLYGAREEMLEELAASNFYSVIHETLLDLVTVGTANLLSEEKPIRQIGFNGFAFQTIPIAEYVIDEDAQGAVDTVFRRFTLTARQAAQHFGLDGLPDAIRAAAQEGIKSDRSFEFVHGVFPREVRRDASRLGKDLAWASNYVAVDGRHVVRGGGYEEMPFHVPRWSKAAREIYGRAPAMLALPDIKTLNLIVRYGLEALPLALYPPFLIKEGTLASGQLQLTPGAQNHWDGQLDDKPTQIDWRGNVAIEQTKEADYRARIMRGMHADKLRMKESPQMTATEVLERREEMLRIVGPTVARLESELLNPLVERCFMLMLRAGALGDVPQAFRQAKRMDIEYASPLAQASKMHRLRALQDWYASNQAAIQTNPQILDIIDAEAAARDAAEILGLPPHYVRSPQAVQQRRAAQAQAQQQQQMAALQAQGAAGGPGAAGPSPAAGAGGADDLAALLQGGGA
ncbi:MAG: head-tail connector protein [Alphaproteobacteria bacterium]|nr:head-tail connector protein [Alphaproteobacteria bacterium]